MTERIAELKSKASELFNEAKSVLSQDTVTKEEQTLADSKFDEAQAIMMRVDSLEVIAHEEEQANRRVEFAEAQRARNNLPENEPVTSFVSVSDFNDAPTAVELRQRSVALEEAPLSDVALKRWPVENLFTQVLRGYLNSGTLYSLSEDTRRAWSDYQKVSLEAMGFTQKASDDALGGVLVPDYLERNIVDEAKFSGPLADDSLITVLRRGSVGETRIPRNTNINTIVPGYVAEEANVTAQDPAWSEATLNPRNFAVQIMLTDQIMQPDVIGIEAYLTRKVGENFGREQNRLFTVGTGTNQPMGVGSISTASRVTETAAASAILFSEITAALKKLDAAYQSRPTTRCMVHYSTYIDMINELEGGTHRYRMLPNGNLVLATGITIVPNNDLSAAGGAGGSPAAVIADLADYTKVQVGGLRFERERKLENFTWLSSWNTFMDAKPIEEAAYSVLKLKS